MRRRSPPYKPLPIGDRGPRTEGCHLITGQVVEHMKVSLALLESGVGASFSTRRNLGVHLQGQAHSPASLSHCCKRSSRTVFPRRKPPFSIRCWSNAFPTATCGSTFRAVFVPLLRRKIVHRPKSAPPSPRPRPAAHPENRSRSRSASAAPSISRRVSPFNLIPSPCLG